MGRKAHERTVKVTLTRTVTQMEKTCPICQRSFWGAKIRRYCSRPCRNKAYYAHHADEHRQRRVEKYHAEKQAAAR